MSATRLPDRRSLARQVMKFLAANPGEEADSDLILLKWPELSGSPTRRETMTQRLLPAVKAGWLMRCETLGAVSYRPGPELARVAKSLMEG